MNFCLLICKMKIIVLASLCLVRMLRMNKIIQKILTVRSTVHKAFKQQVWSAAVCTGDGSYSIWRVPFPDIQLFR